MRLFFLILLGGLLIPTAAAQSMQTPAPTPGPPSEEAAALAKQVSAVTDGAESDAAEDGPEGIVPLTKGFNASLGTTSQHDSAGGWSSLITPNLAYRFDKHFSLSLGLPVYQYINVSETTKVRGPKGVVIGTSTKLQPEHLLLGDTNLIGGFDAHRSWLDYNLSASMGMPTGDDANGLGAGQFTYAIINRFEHSLGDYFTPTIELGVDDSPNLVDTRVRSSYTAVGTSAHFLAGLGVSFPHNITFESDAVEELPLSTQTVTSVTGRGKKGKAITTTSEKSIGEDNGFENALDIPLTGHITLSGFYYRSLRNKIDTAGFSITFLLRAPPRAKKTVVQ